MNVRDLKVKVVAFPVDEYNISDLRTLTGEALLENAKAVENCTIWEDLELFQTYLNGDLVDVDNNWIFFVSEE